MRLTGNGNNEPNISKAGGLKQQIGALGLGILVLAAVFGFVALVSNDARLAYVIGAVLIFCSALWVGPKSPRPWLTAASLCGPLVIAFGLLALPQLPVLWPNLLLWLIAAGIGAYLRGAARLSRRFLVYGAGVLLAASVWYCMSYVPDRLARSLTQFRDASAPTFLLQPVTNGTVPLGPKPGKVLVIDFFATWCAPCIAELPEIANVRADLRDKSDIEFVIVANDSGGDTPQRFKSFAQRRHLTLPIAYDAGGKAHAAFGFTGVPALVVLDKMGRVRLTREGYNAAETNFRRDLVQFLKTL